MKTKDKIREEAEKHCKEENFPTYNMWASTVNSHINFTHSQLKEQQEEIQETRVAFTKRTSELIKSKKQIEQLKAELQSKQKEVDELSEILERVNYMISLNQKIKSNGEFHNKVKQLLKPPCTTSTYGDLGSNK
jgi:chromosome segregation ATPase